MKKISSFSGSNFSTNSEKNKAGSFHKPGSSNKPKQSANAGKPGALVPPPGHRIQRAPGLQDRVVNRASTKAHLPTHSHSSRLTADHVSKPDNRDMNNQMRSPSGNGIQRAPVLQEKVIEHANAQAELRAKLNAPSIVVTDYDSKPAYRDMTSQMQYNDKAHEFSSLMNPFKPASDLKPNKSMEESMNNSVGRVAGALTGQTTKSGVAEGFNQFDQAMQPGDKLNIGKTNATSLEARASMSMADFALPGASAAGLHLGPAGWISANYTHTKTAAINIEKQDDHSSSVQGTDRKTHQGTLGAFGGAKFGVEAGPMIFGPLTGVTGTIGAKHTNTTSSTLAPQHKPGDAIADFAQSNGKMKFEGDQWQDSTTDSKVTYPASLKAEATMTGTTPYYGDNDRFANTGALSVISGVEVGDMRSPKQTANFVNIVSGQLYSDGFVKSNDGASNGEYSRLDAQGPIEHAVNIPSGKHSEETYHGSHWNNPLDRHHHVHKLEEQLGTAASNFAIQEFRNKFGENTPQRNMVFHTETLNDGRVRVDGELNAKVADGYTVRVPGVSHSSTAEGSFVGRVPLFETILPVEPTKA